MSHETDQKTLAEQFYATMLRARRFEEEAFEFYKKGMMPGMAHLYLGEEAVAVGVCTALKPEDCIGSTHRGHGHLVARGADMGRMMAEILGKKTGYSKGKGGTMHIMARDRGILGANGIVGAELPISTGAAYAFKLRKEPRVSVVFFGEHPIRALSTKVSIWQRHGIFPSSMSSKTIDMRSQPGSRG